MKYGYNINFLDNDSELRSYFLGLYVADGWRSGHRRSIYISLTDYDLIEQLIKYTFYTNKTHKRRNISMIDKERMGKVQYMLTYGGPIFDKIVELGFPVVKTGYEFIPRGISDITFQHFMRGLSDGDGSFYTIFNGQLRYSLSCKSSEFLLTIGRKLHALSIVAKPATIGKGHGCMCYQLAHTDAVRLGTWMYANYSIALERKKLVWCGAKDIIAKTRRGWTLNELSLLKSGINPPGRTKSTCITKRHLLRKSGEICVS